MTSGDTGAALVKKTHPIRGILWGIPFGLGLAVVLVLTKVIPLEQAQVVGVFFGGLLIGLLWSMFGPAKKPKGAAPAAAVAVDEPETPDDAAGMDEAGAADGVDQSGGADDADDDSGSDETGDDGESTSGLY